jgi:nitroreductase
MTQPVSSEPLAGYPEYDDDESLACARMFRDAMATRRTVREFDSRPVPRALIEACVETANRAPSGANMRPWHFGVVGDPGIKRRIRVAAEEEEREFYASRAPQEWLDALAPLGTDSNKPFLETAPWLIALFGERHGVLPDGRKVKHYCVPESVCLAGGFLLCALHQAGLATLTHTPSPMGFLNEILERPSHEKPYLLIVTGHPAPGCRVPCLDRRGLDETSSWF